MTIPTIFEMGMAFSWRPRRTWSSAGAARPADRVYAPHYRRKRGAGWNHRRGSCPGDTKECCSRAAR